MKLTEFLIGIIATTVLFLIVSVAVFNAKNMYKMYVQTQASLAPTVQNLGAPVYTLSALDAPTTLLHYEPVPNTLNQPLVVELIINPSGMIDQLFVLSPTTQSAETQRMVDRLKTWRFSMGYVRAKPVFYRIRWSV